MYKKLVAKLMSLMSRRRLKGKLAKAALVLSCMAVFAVTYMLVAPVLTQEWEPQCGLAEHVHDESCYAPAPGAEEPSAEPHTHTEACYEMRPDTKLCELEEHIHGEGCRDENGELTCALEEHSHRGTCFTYAEVLICGLEETDGAHESAGEEAAERVLICGKEEHTHTELCGDKTESSGPEYLCGFQAEHVHSEACYFEDGTLKCTLTEHTHTGACLPAGAEDEEPAQPEETEKPEETGRPEEPKSPEEVAAPFQFPEECPPGYVEETVESAEGLFLQLYIPEGAFDRPVTPSVRVIAPDSGEYDAALAALLAQGIQPQGMAAVDIGFVDESGVEMEPNGTVYVYLAALGLVPADAQDLALHHITGGGVETLSGMFNLMAPLSEESAAVLDVAYAVDSFSVFIIQWTTGHTLEIQYVNPDNTMINGGEFGFLSNITVSALGMEAEVNGKTLFQHIKEHVPAGYHYDHLRLWDATGWNPVEDVAYRYEGGTPGWYYKRNGQWIAWSEGNEFNSLSAVCLPGEPDPDEPESASVTVVYGYYGEKGEFTAFEKQPISEPVFSLAAGTGLDMNDLSGKTVDTEYEFEYFETDNGERLSEVSCSEDGVLQYQAEGSTEWVAWEGEAPVLRVVFRAKGQDPDKLNTVHCYVNVAYQNLRADGSFEVPQNGSAWTDSVYTTYVETTGGYDAGGLPQSYIAAATSKGQTEYYVVRDPNNTGNEVLADFHRTILQMAKPEGYTSDFAVGGQATYRLPNLPSDEEMLQAIRRSGKQIVDSDGVPLDESVLPLTTENFVIRWFAFKYRSDDQWHLDGVLVRKQGHLVVEKTFYGDQEIIEDVQSGDFYIAVDQVDENGRELEDGDHYMLTLGEATYITPGTNGQNTYTWVLDTTVGGRYHIMEYGYTRNADTVATLTEYRFSNISDTAETPNAWTSFVNDPGIYLEGRSYAPDVDYTAYQTVRFRNSYLPKNSLTVYAKDDYTGGELPGVSFRLYKDGGERPATVWRYNGEYYLYRPQVEGTGAVIESTTTLTVGRDGSLTLRGVGDGGSGGESVSGRYRLEETAVPAGYTGGCYLTFDMDGGCTITPVELSPDGAKFGTVSEELHVYRVTFPHDVATVEIYAEKVWAGGKPERVTLELYQNGTPTGAVLSGTAESWSGAFTGGPIDGKWPAYTGGVLAEYTVRETSIGGVNYDDKYPGGYQYYAVRVERTDEVDKTTGEIARIHLVVTNTKEFGSFSFTKTTTGYVPLPGAQFTLYTDKECTNALVQVGQSDANGLVTFTNLPVGIYYMRETRVPEGYRGTQLVFTVTITADSVAEEAGSFSITASGPGSALLEAPSQANGHERYVVMNESAYTAQLPATGGGGVTVWYITGSAFFLAAALLMYKSLRQRRRYGEGGAV